MITIADSGFLPGTLSAFIGGENVGIGPSHFTWQRTDAQSARFVTDGFLPHARGKGQIAWLLEPFFLHPGNYLAAMEKDFEYVLTHDENFVQNREKWLWYPAGGSWIGVERWKVYPKSKNVSMLLSAKKMTRGHRLRHEVLAKYRNQIDAVFGLERRVTPFEALADFRYSVIVENEKSRYWFTEKLIDSFAVGTVPIYWGSPCLENFFDMDGVIEFENLDELGEILDGLRRLGVAEADYARRLPAIRENLEKAKGYRVCEDWIHDHYPFLIEGT